MIKVQMFKDMGRGIVATQGIPKNTVIMECEILVLSESDTKVVNQTDLQYYTFKYNETQDCLVLGLGEIFNHDDTPNVNYQLVEKDGRKMMVFTTIRDIYRQDQLFIDYTEDVKVDTSGYINNPSMI